MISAADILNPSKPAPANIAIPSIMSLEVLIDAQPLLKGSPVEAAGTDLSGTVCLALSAPLLANTVRVEFHGAALEANRSTGLEEPEIVYTNGHNIWTASPVSPCLVAGAHDIRFMFKLPGSLPATEAGRVQYVLRVVITDAGEGELATLVEAVRVRRVLANADGTDDVLPVYPGAYGASPSGPPSGFGSSDFLPPPPSYGGPDGAHEIHDLPPGYDFKGKGKAMSDAKKAQLAASQKGGAVSKAPTPTPLSNGLQPSGAASNSGSGAAIENQNDAAKEIPAGSVLLAVRIPRASNARGAKGDKVSTFLRVQMADFDFKELRTKSSIIPDNPNPEFNFTYDQILHVDENLVDIIANKKLSIFLIESLPKEKTQILGSADVSLAQFVKYPPRDPNSPPTVPYLLPDLQINQPVPISYLNPKLLPAPPKEGEPSNLPEFCIEISLSAPLIAPEVVEQGNFLSFKLEDMFPVPEEWTLKEGNEKDLNSNIYSYTLSFTVPSESMPERLVSITGGSLQHCEAIIPDAPILGAQPVYCTKPADPPAITVVSDAAAAPEAESGDVGSSNVVISTPAPPPPPAETASNAPETKQSFKKVAWPATLVSPYLVWIPPEAVAKLRERIVAKVPLDVEFSRELLPRFAHVTDTNALKYRGKAALDVAALMYPRVSGVRGRFLLDLYPDAAGNTANDSEHVSGKGRKGRDESAHAGTSYKLKYRQGTENATVYKTIGSHIGIEIGLEKPLLDKKKLQPISKSVSDFIPKRTIPAHMLHKKRAEKADQEFRDQIQATVKNLVKEYQKMLTETCSSAASAAESDVTDHTRNLDCFDIINPASLDEEQKRKKRFLYHMNKSGAYFNLKEQLKTSVVNVVRETFRKNSPFSTQAELQLFLSELYVYLLDQMHISIHKMFKDVDSAFTDPSVIRTADFSMLKSFADQSELDNDFALASVYHKERIAKYDDSIQTWFDYGASCMRNSQSSKGVECFKELLARNSKHIPTLLAYGAICTSAEKYEEARVYLVTATELQPKHVLSLTILGLFYQITGEEIESEKYLEEAVKTYKMSMASTEVPNDDNNLNNNSSVVAAVMLKAAEFLVSVHATQMADAALSCSLLKTGPSIAPYLLLSQLETQKGNLMAAVENIKSAMQVQQDDPDVWAALGHLQFRQKCWNEAQSSYETVLSLPKNPTNLPLICMRVGFLYLKSLGSITKKVSERSYAEVEHAKKAKTMYIQASEIKPSSKSWLGVARACILLGQYDEAEDSLSEANVLNNRDSEVWAHLALLCLIQDRSFEAGQCIAQAIRHKIKDPEVLKSVPLSNFFQF
ncbi:Cilia- and flagella-associated protein 70 [Entophlyctis luteolus]|nr:Cilia- and flagella-associated protein 70 [Entophlyctis luteolus]